MQHRNHLRLLIALSLMVGLVGPAQALPARPARAQDASIEAVTVEGTPTVYTVGSTSGSGSSSYVSFSDATGPTLTFTTADPTTGTIIVEKQTEPDGGTDAFDFTGDATGSIHDNETITVSDLAPGAYHVQETALSWYRLATIVCSDDNSVGDLPNLEAEFQLEAGETVTCTFLNVAVMDYGDAPDSYKTLWASDGARHSFSDIELTMGISREQT